jgi:quercetin dioxygenase-like cupin family protein
MDKSPLETLEKLIHTGDVDPHAWIVFPEYGFRQFFLWKNDQTGATIALLDFEEGGRIPVKHTHASNQFMYCIQGEYEYTDTGLRLRSGSFYMNPKDHPHGPTLAHTRCLILEIYDGPHYYERPSFHDAKTLDDQLLSPNSADE